MHKNVIFETDKSEMEVNKQENGYECGMHVLEIAYQLIDTNFYSSGTLETNQQGYPDWHLNQTSNRNLLLFCQRLKVENWQPDCVNVSQCRLRLKSAIARLAKESTPVS